MITISKKVCLLGDFAVGKTSLVRQLVYNRFDDKYLSTIGVKVSRKTMNVPGTAGVVELNMLLWDLAGSEEFTPMRASYLRGAAGAVLVCDLTRPETLDSVHSYAEDLHSINPDSRFILAANKADLVDWRHLSDTQIEEAATSLNAAYYLTSAKTGEAVEPLFRHLGRLIS